MGFVMLGISTVSALLMIAFAIYKSLDTRASSHGEVSKFRQAVDETLRVNQINTPWMFVKTIIFFLIVLFFVLLVFRYSPGWGGGYSWYDVLFGGA